jgi:hypothetical protein
VKKSDYTRGPVHAYYLHGRIRYLGIFDNDRGKFFLLMRSTTMRVRTHLALGKDAPLGRAVQRSGVIVAILILSGPLCPDIIFGKDTCFNEPTAALLSRT